MYDLKSYKTASVIHSLIFSLIDNFVKFIIATVLKLYVDVLVYHSFYH